MKRPVGSLEASVSAFRDATATPADGGATRARVLACAGRSTGRRGSLRRASLLIAGAIAVCSSASVAWTVSNRSWRAPVPVALDTPAGPSAAIGGAGRPVRVIPAPPGIAFGPESAIASASASTNAGAEERLYSQAHLAHFAGDAPARALTLWDTYLARYPGAALAPEARYNRAICLVRLSRFAEAARALRPFADGALGGYRQQDAGVLLDWLAERAR